MLMNQRYYLVPKNQGVPCSTHPYEFSPQEIRVIKILVNIGHQHLKENKDSCPWPDKAEDILKQIQGLTDCLPFKVLLTAEEYEALYALMTLGLQLAQQPPFRSMDFLFEVLNKEESIVYLLMEKITENMERLRKQEALGTYN